MSDSGLQYADWIGILFLCMCSGIIQFLRVVSLFVYIHIVGTDSVSGGLKSGKGGQTRG